MDAIVVVVWCLKCIVVAATRGLFNTSAIFSFSSFGVIEGSEMTEGDKSGSISALLKASLQSVCQITKKKKNDLSNKVMILSPSSHSDWQ